MPTDKTIIANSLGSTGLTVATSFGAGTLSVIEDPTVTTDDSTGSAFSITPANLVKGAIGNISGVAKLTAGVLSQATAGTDYEAPITAGTTAQYLKGDKSLGTLNQAAVAGLTAASSPAFAGATIGSLAGILKGTAGVVGTAAVGSDYLAPAGNGSALTGLTASQVAAPGSTTQTLYNLAGALTGNANLTVGTGGETVLGPVSAPTISGTGQVWNDSTRGVATVATAGVAAPLGGLIWVATSAGTAVASSIAQTSILTGASAVGSLTIPANAALAGKVLTLGFSGTITSTGTPTLTITVYFGTTLIASTGALSPTAAGPVSWTMESAKCGMVIQVAGAGGKVYGVTQFNSGLANGSANLPSGGTGNAVPSQVSVDFTGAQAIDIRAQWSVSSASNTVQLKGGWFRLEG